MFGLSLTKILFTVLLIVAIWRAFALVSRLQDLRQGAAGPPRSPDAGAPSRRRASATAPSPRAVDLVECPSCGAYVPRGETCRCRHPVVP